MSDRDLSAEAAALARQSGFASLRAEAEAQPAYLMDRSVRMFPELRGDEPYLRRLDNAAHDLYHQIINDASVLAHIDSLKSVMGEGRTRGMIGPFRAKQEPDHRKSLKWLLHTMAFLASSPTVLEKKLTSTTPIEETTDIRDQEYVGISLTDADFGSAKGKYPLKRDRLAQMVYALSAFKAEFGPWVRLHAGRHDDVSGQGVVTRLKPLTPIC